MTVRSAIRTRGALSGPPADRALAYSEATQFHYALSAECRRLELDGLDEQAIRREIAPARSFLAESSFIRHLQQWPHGYPGDWEIIEQILEIRNRSEPHSWGWYLEQSALDTPAAHQHREKVRWQAERVEHCLRHTRRPRILALACGGGRDLEAAARSASASEASFYLNDAEDRALELARKRIADVAGRVELAPGNALHAARRLRNQEPFDLVLAGGLFDYLDDRAATLLLRTVAGKLLRPGGALHFTNISPDNPCRPWMDYAVDWRLIARTPQDLAALCSAAGVPKDNLEVVRDRTGIALLATVRSPR